MKRAQAGEALSLAAHFEAYVSLGLPPGRVWKITPRLAHHEMRGAEQRLRREHDERAWLAWHAAYLPGSGKVVPLARLTTQRQEGRPARAPRRDWRADLAAWAAYATKAEGRDR